MDPNPFFADPDPAVIFNADPAAFLIRINHGAGPNLLNCFNKFTSFVNPAPDHYNYY